MTCGTDLWLERLRSSQHIYCNFPFLSWLYISHSHKLEQIEGWSKLCQLPASSAKDFQGKRKHFSHVFPDLSSILDIMDAEEQWTASDTKVPLSVEAVSCSVIASGCSATIRTRMVNMGKILALCPVRTNEYRVGILYLKKCKMSCSHRIERMRLHPSKQSYQSQFIWNQMLLISPTDVFLQNAQLSFKVCGFPLVEIFC